MLDAFKTFSPGKGKAAAAIELQTLIASAREERGALSEMLTQVALRSAKLVQMGKSLEQVEQKAAGASDRIDHVGQRFADLDARIKGFEEIDARMKQLLDTVKQAQQSVEKITGPGSELQTHREALQQLSSQALQTQASIETLKKDRAAMEDFRGELSRCKAGSGSRSARQDRSRATWIRCAGLRRN